MSAFGEREHQSTQDTYDLNAGVDQPMRVTITLVEDNAVFDVVSPSGKLLQQEATGADLYLPEKRIWVPGFAIAPLRCTVENVLLDTNSQDIGAIPSNQR